jgi:hypothetical protein
MAGKKVKSAFFRPSEGTGPLRKGEGDVLLVQRDFGKEKKRVARKHKGKKGTALKSVERLKRLDQGHDKGKRRKVKRKK